MTPLLAERVNNSRAGIISQDELDKCRAQIAEEFWNGATVWERKVVIACVPRDSKGDRRVQMDVAELPFGALHKQDKIRMALAAADLLERIARISYIWP